MAFPSRRLTGTLGFYAPQTKILDGRTNLSERFSTLFSTFPDGSGSLQLAAFLPLAGSGMLEHADGMHSTIGLNRLSWHVRVYSPDRTLRDFD